MVCILKVLLSNLKKVVLNDTQKGGIDVPKSIDLFDCHIYYIVVFSCINSFI